MPTIYLNGRYLTQPVTGVQRHATELVRALDRALGDGPAGLPPMTVLAPKTARPGEPLAHIPVRRVGRLTGQAWEQLELPRCARDGVLFSFANTGPLTHRRQAVTIHDASVFAVPQTYSATFRLWYRFLQPRLGRTARLVVTDSTFSHDELTRLARIPAERLRVVPLGCEHIRRTEPDDSVLRQAGLDTGPFVLAAGSHRPHKNLQLVERAMSGPEAPRCRLVTVGAPDRRVFGATHAGSAATVALGYVTDGQLRALYQAARCFVFPSRYEGFGLPPLEAMSCGCPTIVARAAALPEVCGDASLYVAPDDAAGLARAIRSLLEDEKLRSTLRARGLARAREFTWSRTARLTLDLMRELIGAP